MFFVKGRSKRDADPWRLGRGQRRRVLPTRKRVSTFSFSFLSHFLSILPSGTTWWTTLRSLCKATVWWPPNTDTQSMLDWQSEYQTNHFIHKLKICGYQNTPPVPRQRSSSRTGAMCTIGGNSTIWKRILRCWEHFEKSETLVRRTSTFTATTTTWTSRCRWGSCCTRDGTTTINLLAHAQSFEGKLTFLVKWRLLPWNRYCLCLLFIIVLVTGQKQTTETKSSSIFFKEMNDSKLIFLHFHRI